MIKVLLLSRYPRRGASSRMRTLQYLPYLKSHGFHVDVVPFYSETYLNGIYKRGRRTWAGMASSHVRRALTVRHAFRYDLVWVEKEIFPWVPAIAERRMHAAGIPYVVDYDDAIFHRYDTHRHRLVKGLLGRKIDSVMRLSAMVIAGNRYLAGHARNAAGAKNVVLLPTVIDLQRYAIRDHGNGSPFTIGWIGSPTTAVFLDAVMPVLRQLQARYNIRVVIVGAKPEHLQRASWEFIPWSEETEVGCIKQFDVGIMPLPDTPWTQGKCGYKLIQYMACGVPVIASRVGANIDVVRNGRHGFLASTEQEWYTAIEALYLSRELRQAMAMRCRKHVEKRYHLGITAPVLAECLRQAMEGPR